MSPLYEEWFNNIWVMLEANEIINYLPLNKVSMEAVSVIGSAFIDPQLIDNLSYRRFKLFEPQIHENGNLILI